MNKTTILKLRKLKQENKKAVLITAYDYFEAKLAAPFCDIVLCGDSLNMAVCGKDTTLGATMEQMLYHTEMVVRGCNSVENIPFIWADLPFMSYQSSIQSAIENSGKFACIGCDAIKVEGYYPEVVSAISKAGMIPVAHVGLTPAQKCKLGGKYLVTGKTKKDYEVLLEQALGLQDAGAMLMLGEAIPTEPAAMIKEKLKIPFYSIGGGPHTDGSLVIIRDMLGMFTQFKSKFVKRYAEIGQMISRAIETYSQEVRDNVFPDAAHSYECKDEELLDKLAGDPMWKYTKIEETVDCGPSSKTFPLGGC